MPFVEDYIGRDINHIAAAYTRLMNACQQGESVEEAVAYLREFRIRSRDLAENIRKVLYEHKVPIPLSEVRDLNQLMAKQDCHHLFILAQHYCNRFIWADEGTSMKCLTAAYFGMRDLAECIEATPVETFYKEVFKS